jgi:hexosaminidase
MALMRRSLVLLSLLSALGSGGASRVDAATVAVNALIPKPVSVVAQKGTFALGPSARVVVEPRSAELMRIGRYLAGRLSRGTGFRITVAKAAGAGGNIHLALAKGDGTLGHEGYELTVSRERVDLVAPHPAGLFHGVQTLRQLLPPSIESSKPRRGPWRIPTASIRDYPRFAWRGAMLDVARHFFGVKDVKRFIDLLAYYKLNRLHLHLSDDQGWRIAINAWPRLATHGGSTQVGGGRGGYYTQKQYAELAAYAQSRYIVLVPEIDMPGHTNAALSSYPELTCDGVAPPLYTGTEVGFSSLCTSRKVVFAFVSDVVEEIAALTPGPYMHIGGDEASATSPGEYVRFVERIQQIVAAHGTRTVGWEEIAKATLRPTSIVQHWHSELAGRAAKQGAKVIMSPATKAYMDMKYNPSTSLGLKWAGYTDVRDAYNWDPANQVAGVSEGDVLGVEAPLWSETITTMADIEFMSFPRLPGYAEVGWSRKAGRTWSEYRRRLALHGPRLAELGVNFYRSPQVPWS